MSVVSGSYDDYADESALGYGESRKTTLLKQIRLQQRHESTPVEKMETRQIMFSDIVLAYKIKIEEIPSYGISITNIKSLVCSHVSNFRSC